MLPIRKLSIHWRYVSAFALLTFISLIFAEIAWRFLLPSFISRYAHSGDYYFDADPALVIGMHGNIFNMYSVSPVPAMMPLALLLRLPELLIGSLLSGHGLAGGVLQHHRPGGLIHSTPVAQQRYLIGAMGLSAIAGGMISVAYLSCEWTWKHMKEIITAVLIAAVMILNPLARSALSIGHPEELLMAGFLGAATFSFYRERYTWSGILLAAAVATKQPAVFAIPAFYFALPRVKRKTTIKVFLITLIVAVLPFIILHFMAVLKANISYGNGGLNVSDHAFDISTAINWTAFSSIEKILLVGVAAGLPLAIARKDPDRTIRLNQFLYLLPLVMIFRCIFDPGNINYYAVPVVATFLALETYLWEQQKHLLIKLLPKAARLPMVPIISLVIAYYLSEFTGGHWYADITYYLSTHVSNLFYLFMMLLLIIPLLVSTTGWQMKLNRARISMYLAVLLGIGAVFVAVILTYSPPGGRHLLPAPPGYVSMSPTSIAKKIRPRRIYWIGSKGLKDGNFLRLSAMAVGHTQIIANAKDSKPTNDKYPQLSMFDYGQENGSVSLTIFTYKAGSMTLVRALKACNDNCEQWYKIKTPIGQGYMMKVGDFWQAVIPRKQLVYINDNGTGLRPSYVLSKLKPVSPVSSALPAASAASSLVQ